MAFSQVVVNVRTKATKTRTDNQPARAVVIRRFIAAPRTANRASCLASAMPLITLARQTYDVVMRGVAHGGGDSPSTGAGQARALPRGRAAARKTSCASRGAELCASPRSSSLASVDFSSGIPPQSRHVRMHSTDSHIQNSRRSAQISKIGIQKKN